jgi:3-hydroxypropanoate dehydrogenase
MRHLDEDALRLLLLDARTHHGWDGRPVEDATLVALYEAVRMGPTANNSSPLRVAFVRSPEAKELLLPAVAAGNQAKTQAAPVTAVLAADTGFHAAMGKLVPHDPEAGARVGRLDEARRERMANLNATLQAGYFILAARGLGLDCGPMGGFDAAAVDAAFLAGTAWRSFLLVNLGHGDLGALRPRAPRLDFGEACQLL